MSRFPFAEESYARLHAAGWSTGETGAGAAVLVTGTSSENVIYAEGASSDEAW
jgi:hypothetical protein